MEAKQKGAIEQRAAMTIRYGKTFYVTAWFMW